ncbi:MAG: Trehalose utilization [Planctomycetota bacterium]|nr:Trehalose utilization [Planctomycetota bacterium]
MMHIPRLLFVAAVFVSFPVLADAPKPLKALLVTGGCCHDYTAQKAIIKEGLESRANIEVTVVQQGGTGTNAKIPLYENVDWSRGYDIVLHDECFSDVKEPEWTARILKPHKEGLPGVVIHCAMHCYRDGTTQWFEFCGVTSRRHGAGYPHEVLNRDPTHPIMKGFGPAWANPAGELYWIEKVWPTAHPLGVSKNRETGAEETCVWTNQYGKGRVFGTTLGHHNETVNSPVFLDMLTRGTLWACNKLDDQYLKTPKPAEARVNLAKGRPTLASSEESGKNNFARLAVDGDLGTRWCANRSDPGEWLQVDLGQPERISGVALDWETEGTTYRCKVDGSTDGTKWTTLTDASKNDKPGPRQLDYPANKEPFRFVRVTYLGSSTGAWGSLREVRVFGDKTVTINANDLLRQADAAVLGEVKIPDGYEATVFAQPPAVQYPVAVAAGANGDVFVSVDKNGSLGRATHRGSVFRLRDLDGDGRADEVNLFVPDVDSPRGLVWDHDRLYLMHPPHLSAYIDHDGDGRADEEQVLVKNIAFGFKDRPADHTSNGVTLGIDGWLYLAIGDFGFMEAEGTDGKKLQLRGGGVVRVRPDGTNLEIYSRGTRNILEVSVDPRLNGFARDNTNDGGGWDIRLHHFSGLEHHGYPSLYQNFRDETIAPLADYGGGSGCGGLYLSEPGFPGKDGDALYTADWGRNWIFRHHVTPKGATFSADQAEFISVPRVTDLDVDASSHLYVASWKGAVFDYAGENVGFLVRVSPRGYQPDPLPDLGSTSNLGLVKLLESPSHRRRVEAQRALLRRDLGDEKTVEALKALAADKMKSRDVRIAALFAIKQGRGENANPFLATLSEDSTIREYALRALADRTDEMVNVPAQVFRSAILGPNPRIRLQGLRGLARLGQAEHAAPVGLLLADTDPIVAHTAARTLTELRASDVAFGILDRSECSPSEKAAAVRVVGSLHEPAVVTGVISLLEASTDLATRRLLFTALCRLHSREGRWKGESWGTRPDTTGPYYQAEAWSETPRIVATLKAALLKAAGDDAAFFNKELTRHKLRLDFSLDSLVGKAEKDPSLVPLAVDRLAGSETIPASAIALLIRAATGDQGNPDLRSRAVVALSRTDTEAAFRAILKSLPLLKGRDLSRARDAFLTAPSASHHVELFRNSAAKLDEPAAVWAEAAMLVVSTSPSSSPEARANANRAIEADWSDPSRRAQILRAVALANHRPFAEKVAGAVTDPDAAVASAARSTAASMHLDPARMARLHTGPRVGDLTLDEILKTSETPTNERSEGERIFGQLSCVNCHTVTAGDPPRGPFLGTIAATYKRRELAEAILSPSKTLAQGFVTNVFALTDGRTLSGFVVQEAADAVTIRTSEGTEIRLPSSEVEQRTKTQVSVMPEGLVKDLTVAEFSGLIDFLQSLAVKPAK